MFMKSVIRKGIFETSSSSEDSLSVYQDMKLYILPKDIYDKFVDGKIYLRVSDQQIYPEYVENEIEAIDKNNEMIAKIGNKIRVESSPKNKFFYCPHYSSDGIRFMNKFFVDYETYKYIICRYYSDYSLFNYENNGDMIFGFFGYTEE